MTPVALIAFEDTLLGDWINKHGDVRLKVIGAGDLPGTAAVQWPIYEPRRREHATRTVRCFPVTTLVRYYRRLTQEERDGDR